MTTAEVAAAEVAAAEVATAEVATAEEPETSADVWTSSEVSAAADSVTETTAEAEMVKFPLAQSTRQASLMAVHSEFGRTLASLHSLDAARQSLLHILLGLYERAGPTETGVWELE